MKRLLAVCWGLFLGLCACPVWAEENFTINHQLHYEIHPNGSATVNQEISLTNQLADVYATRYSLTLQEVSVSNVSASDAGGPIQPQISRQGRETTVALVFNQPAVGKEKTLRFNLNYDALNLAQKNGQVWEINIPQLVLENASTNGQMTLAVPTSFGRLALMRPAPLKSETRQGVNLYFFDLQQAIGNGVNANFGEFQIFDFVLTYHLDNPTHSQISTEIALPPDTAFQQVLYQKLTPPPLNVRLDNDGNWLAQYQLRAQEKININAMGQAKIFATPQNDFLIPHADTIKRNLASQTYWPVDHPLIQAKAKQLTTPRAIYDFVVNHLEYRLDRVADDPQRLGALAALQNPQQAICTEFTDLFIALARAAGIPAREINGFAYTTNAAVRPLGMITDILHAWPEYWDESHQVWIPVDPTWGKTTNGVDYFSKTDMNHFAFAIHGEQSNFPYPAGSYKATDTPSKDVQVEFGQKLVDVNSQVAVNFQLPGAITIENTGRNALYYLKPQVTSVTLRINLPESSSKNIIVLPPFAKQKIQLTLASLKPFNFQDNLVTVVVNGQSFRQTVKIYAFPWQVAAGGGGLILLIIILFLTRPWNYAKKT